MEIKLTDTDLTKTNTFANTIDTGHYASRGQFNNTKRRDQQIGGKLAEIAAYSYLTSKQIDVSYPDFAIYKKSAKSWNCDLKSSAYEFHVKSQTIESKGKYGASWVFERGDEDTGKGADKGIFKDILNNSYVCLVNIDLITKIADIKAIVKVTDLHEHKLFKPMKLDYLISKRAVYYDDLVAALGNDLLAL